LTTLIQLINNKAMIPGSVQQNECHTINVQLLLYRYSRISRCRCWHFGAKDLKYVNI